MTEEPGPGACALGLTESPVLSLLHIRPLLPNEVSSGCQSIISVQEAETVAVQGRRYTFDSVIGAEAGGRARAHMCEAYIRPLVRNVCAGINCAVFAYGQTSSGKTYTMGIGKEQLAELAGPGGLVLPDPRHLHPQHSPQHPYCPHQHSPPPAAAGSPLSGGASPELAGPAAGGSGAAAAAAPTAAGSGNDGGGGGGAEDLVIPYALRQLFGCVEAAKGARAFTLMVSFVEVYMEKFYDLLSGRAPVAAKTSREGEVLLVGAALRQVTCMEEVVRLLQIGGHARVTKGTNQNDRSSRSHAVLTIHVTSRALPPSSSSSSAGPPTPAPGTPPPEPSSASTSAPAPTSAPISGASPTSASASAALSAALAAPPLSARLHLVDLAGSESVGRAGAVGLAAKEGNTINLSLMTLRNLIQMLAAPKPPAGAPPRVLPYRDSKLTQLLRDALGGNSSTLFVACVSPADCNAAMSVSTLEFATTARRIRTQLTVNIGGGADSAEVLQLHRIINKLRNELDALRRQVASGGGSVSGVSGLGALMSPSPHTTPHTTPPPPPHQHGLLPQEATSPGSAAWVLSFSAAARASTPAAAGHAAGATAGAASAVPKTVAEEEEGEQQEATAGSARVMGRELEVVSASTAAAASAAAAAAADSTAGGSAAGALADTESGSGSGSESGSGSCESDGDAESKLADQDPLAPLLDPNFKHAHSHGLRGAHPELLHHPHLMHLRRHRHRQSRSEGGPALADTAAAAAATAAAPGSPDVSPLSIASAAIISPQRLRVSFGSGRALAAPSSSPAGGGIAAGGASGSGGFYPAPCSASPRLSAASGGGGGASAMRLSRSQSQLSEALSLSVSSIASYGGFGGYGGGVGGGGAEGAGGGWGRMARLSQRVVLLEAENEHLTKQVTNLSAVIGDLRRQLDAAHAALLMQSAAAAPPSPSTPPPDDLRGCSGTNALGAGAGSSTDTAAFLRSAGGGGGSASAGGSFTAGRGGRWVLGVGGTPSAAAARYNSAGGAPLQALAVPAATTAEAMHAADASGAGPERVLPPEGGEAGAVVDLEPELGFAAGVVQAAVAGAAEQEEEQQQQQQQQQADGAEAGADAEGLAQVEGPEPWLEAAPLVLEDRPRALLTWIGQRVAEAESELLAQREALRRMLAEQGLAVRPSLPQAGTPATAALGASRTAAAAPSGGTGAAAATERAGCAAEAASRAEGSEADAGGGCGLPSLDTLMVYAAQQADAAEAELRGLGLQGREDGAGAEAAEAETAAEAELGLSEADVARAAALRARLESLAALQRGVQRASELEASLELQREVQLLVGAYAGLYGTGTDTATAAAPGGGSRGGGGAAAGGAGGAAAVTSGGGAAGPAVQRAALAAEQQLAALRRARRGQVLKEAAVAREKMRELEARPGPPLPVHYGVVLLPPPYGPGLAGGGRGGAQGPILEVEVDAGEGAWADMTAGGDRPSPKALHPAHSATGSDAVTPKPPTPATAASTTSSIFASFLPSTSWRRSGSARHSEKDKDAVAVAASAAVAGGSSARELQKLGSMASDRSSGSSKQLPLHQHGSGLSGAAAAGAATASGGGGGRRLQLQLQLSQVGPWLDALLDWETRSHTFHRVLRGALQEREAVYAQLQDVERELAEVREGARLLGPRDAAASSEPCGGGPVPADARSGSDGGGASFGGWVPPGVATLLAAGGEPGVRQHAASLAARQAKLQARLEELCTDVASLQLAIVEAQDEDDEAAAAAAAAATAAAVGGGGGNGGSCGSAASGPLAPSRRDEWWGCVPSLVLARPALRLLLERAAEYKAAYQEALGRADSLEHQVAELELQCQEAEARLAAHDLELTATRAAALAAVAAPGLLLPPGGGAAAANPNAAAAMAHLLTPQLGSATSAAAAAMRSPFLPLPAALPGAAGFAAGFWPGPSHSPGLSVGTAASSSASAWSTPPRSTAATPPTATTSVAGVGSGGGGGGGGSPYAQAQLSHLPAVAYLHHHQQYYQHMQQHLFQQLQLQQQAQQDQGPGPGQGHATYAIEPSGSLTFPGLRHAGEEPVPVAPTAGAAAATAPPIAPAGATAGPAAIPGPVTGTAEARTGGIKGGNGGEAASSTARSSLSVDSQGEWDPFRNQGNK